MDNSTMSTNFIEIISGTNNKASRYYIEATKKIDSDSSKSMAYIKNFISSIENIASKDNVKDERITKTRGNISKFSGYDNIKTAIEFLEKNLGKIEDIKNLVTIYESLTQFQPQYTDGYDKNLRLIILEYECGVYLLVTGLSAIMANSIDVVQSGYDIKIQKKNERSANNTMKIIRDFAKQISAKSHKEYLEELIKNKDNVPLKTNIEESVSFLESSIGDTVDLISSLFQNIGKIASGGKRIFIAVKNSIFGIVPLIRSVLYLRYKKKADTILALDQQVKFIQMNIDQLQNKRNMDPKKKAEIIAKQKAIAESYKKRAAKLRAELNDGEREAVTAIKKEDPEIKNTDGDFVLEGVSLSKMFTDDDYFGESKMKNKPSDRSSDFVKKKRYKAFSMKKLFDTGKKSSEDHQSEPDNDQKNNASDTEALCKKCYEEFFNKTKRSSIRLFPIVTSDENDDDMKNRTKTKLGGNPYWPKSDEFPTYKGYPMVLLAQLNFSELPKIPGFPTTGLLQFFCGTWSGWGKDVVSCVYHETFLDEADMLIDIPRSPIMDDYPPFTEMCMVKAKEEEIPMGVPDRKFIETIMPIFNSIFDEKLEKPGDVWHNPNMDKILDIIYDHNDGGTRVGGHPYFTQDDRRSDEDEILLLQIDSEGGMMWGDCGIANFFISKSDLASKKFKGNVMFTWDCH